MPAVGSPVAAVQELMFVSVPLAGTVTVTVKFVVAPFARLTRVGQVTTPVVKIPPAEALTNVTPAGNVSRTTTFEDVEPPRLVVVTTDRDFAGTGVASWSTPNLMRALANVGAR